MKQVELSLASCKTLYDICHAYARIAHMLGGGLTDQQNTAFVELVESTKDAEKAALKTIPMAADRG